MGLRYSVGVGDSRGRKPIKIHIFFFFWWFEGLGACFFSLEMTYQIHIVDDTVVGEKKMKVADGNGDYVRLGYLNDVEAVGFGGQGSESRARGCCSFCWWMKAVFFCVFVLVAAACFFIWGGPFLINKVMFVALNYFCSATSFGIDFF